MKKIAPTIIVIIFICIGFFIGRFSISLKFNKYIQRFSRSELLGNILDDDEKISVSKAYKKVLPNDLDTFSYAIPNVPTPFVGNAPAPGKHNNTIINNMQFRKCKSISNPKPTNIYRIFLVGGSTAFCSAAPDDNSIISAYLENFLNKEGTATGKTFEVITAANPAWSSTHERIFIGNRLSELEADMVVAFSGVNDVHWGYEGKNVLWFRTFADDFYFKIIKKAYQIAALNPPLDVTDTNEIPIHAEVVASRLLKNTKISNFILGEKKIKYLFFLQPNLAVTKKELSPWEKESLSKKRKYFRNCYKEIDQTMSKPRSNNFFSARCAGLS